MARGYRLRNTGIISKSAGFIRIKYKVLLKAAGCIERITCFYRIPNKMSYNYR